MKRTLVLLAGLAGLAGLAQATPFGDNYLGVSKSYTTIENQVMTKCANVEGNIKAWETCKKRVTKNILKNKKRKSKILIEKKGKK